jgi:hypothetical protein
MDDASSRIFDLQPVTFVYNGDTHRETQYGLIAEDVAQVFPNLVVEDSNGDAMAVRYEVLPVLLLNEVQKLKSSFDSLQTIVNQQQPAIDHLKAIVVALKMQIDNLQSKINN